MKESLKNLRLNMYIILVKCNDHLFYVTKIIWSVIDTAKDQHKSKQEVYVYLYSDFFPRANVLVHSETKYKRDEIINNRFLSTEACLLPSRLKSRLVAFKSKQIKNACTFLCMRGSRGRVRVSELRPWKIQKSKNIDNLHIKITEYTIIGTAPGIGN